MNSRLLWGLAVALCALIWPQASACLLPPLGDRGGWGVSAEPRSRGPSALPRLLRMPGDPGGSVVRALARLLRELGLSGGSTVRALPRLLRLPGLSGGWALPRRLRGLSGGSIVRALPRLLRLPGLPGGSIVRALPRLLRLPGLSGGWALPRRLRGLSGGSIVRALPRLLRLLGDPGPSVPGTNAKVKLLSRPLEPHRAAAAAAAAAGVVALLLLCPVMGGNMLLLRPLPRLVLLPLSLPHQPRRMGEAGFTWTALGSISSCQLESMMEPLYIMSSLSGRAGCMTPRILNCLAMQRSRVFQARACPGRNSFHTALPSDPAV
jgi:hypothetical protein